MKKAIEQIDKKKMIKNPIETILGALVISAALYCAMLLLSAKPQSISAGYNIYAEFSNVNGVAKGTEIKISGMIIGKILTIDLDKKTYKVKIKAAINKKIKIPSDSSIKIRNSGLLGGKYLEIVPGIEDEILGDDDYLYFTQDAIDIEDMIGKFMIK